MACTAANVDLKTDSLIQQTIRRKFADCTVLTIAHRIATILDSTKIMVMDQGRCIEFDTPANLLARPDSVFKYAARDIDIHMQDMEQASSCRKGPHFGSAMSNHVMHCHRSLYDETEKAQQRKAD